MSRRNRGPEFIDLFAGGGGLSLGFRQAGLHQRTAVEADEHAVDTLYLNHPAADPASLLRRDVRSLLTDEKFLDRHRGVTLLIGGPPCQPYSIAHRHRKPDRTDGRRFLFRPFVRLGKELGVRMIVMENVPGLQTASGGGTLSRILALFRKAGFAVSYRVLDASEYGVPQFRRRMFFVALNRLLWKDPERSLETFWSAVEARARHAPVTVQEALSGIPVVGAGSGGLAVRKLHRGKVSGYAKALGSGTRYSFNHQARAHNARDLRIFAALRPGEIAKWLDAREPGLIPYQVESFPDKFRRIRASRPAPTIPAHLSRDANSFVHPYVPRGITCREAARLQSFPDDYIFLGGFAASFKQTGNAVPPVLSRAVAKAALTLLRSSKLEQTVHRPISVRLEVTFPQDHDTPAPRTELTSNPAVALPVGH
jgi:DNA (cytosine-5)-methyltransferase 1